MSTEKSPVYAEQHDPRRWLALWVVSSAAFLAVLDFFILNISIPAIQADLGASFAQIQWLIAGYGLAYAIFLITGGRLGDIYGRKRVFMLGVIGFTLASALCGFAPGARILVASRVLQGLTAAIMFPQVLAIIQVSFPAHEKSRAFAVFGAAIGLAMIAAQLIGGLLIDANLFGLHWRPIFLVNLPVGIATLLAARPMLAESKAAHALQLDFGGVVLATLTLTLLMFPLVEGRELGWPVWSWLMLAASVPMLALFIRYEKWKMQRDGSPLIELDLFQDSGFVTGLFVTLAFFAGLSAFFITVTIYLQQGAGFSASRAGGAFVPFATGFFVASTLSGKMMHRFGRYILNVGATLMLTGQICILLLVRRQGAELTLLPLLPVTLVYGFGQGTVMPQLANIVLSGVSHRHAGSASGVLITVQQFALSVGVAAIGNVFFGALGGNPQHASYAKALVVSLQCNIGLLVVASLLAFMLPRQATLAEVVEDPAAGLI